MISFIGRTHEQSTELVIINYEMKLIWNPTEQLFMQVSGLSRNTHADK